MADHRFIQLLEQEIGMAETEQRSDVESYARASDVLANAILKLFKAGGYGLLAFFTGTIMLLFGMVRGEESFGAVIGWIGLGFICIVLAASFLGFNHRKAQIKRLLIENAALIDGLQNVAVKVADNSKNLQALLLVHVQSVQEVIVAAGPLLEMFGVPKIDRSNLSARIVTYLERAKQQSEDARRAFLHADPRPLREYAETLQSLYDATNEVLKRGPMIDRVSQENIMEVFVLLQSSLRDACETATTLLQIADTHLNRARDIGVLLTSLPIIGDEVGKRGMGRVIQDGDRLLEILTTAGNINTSIHTAVTVGKWSDLQPALVELGALKRAAVGLLRR